ncbi:DUF4350 domain-containing protein [Streptomyces sp. NPDC060194]|uniref:DUF4350 domain-containing protein n=1 Tax=Streptomyces sp. NPDC060194 TaxID=3347069 RepID=UPI0036506CE3
MTDAPAAPTDTGPDPSNAVLGPTRRDLWTRSRGLLLALAVLLIAGFAIAALRSGDEHGRLDPRSYTQQGAKAVAELLADHGVDTRVVTSTSAAAAAAGPDTTLLVASPDLLTDSQLRTLRSAVTDSGGRTVLLAPGDASLDTLAPDVDTATPAPERTLRPDCPLPAARRAGTADTGGTGYRTDRPDVEGCYPIDGRPSLLLLPAPGGGDTVLLGTATPLLNERLDQQGNASLGLQLLGSRPHLVWYLPSLSDSSAAGDQSLTDVIPAGWYWATLQLAVAALVTVLWRSRRLGPLVTERLPVVIRASETTEGRARLYRKADARDRAADALRAATRARLAPVLGIHQAHADSPDTLLPALVPRLGDPAHWDPASLLFGPPPADDAALTALADRLDALEREVRTS